MQEPRDESWPPALSANEEIAWVVMLRGLDEEGIWRSVLAEQRRRLERPDYPEGYFDGPRFVLSVEQPLRLPNLQKELSILAGQSESYSPQKNGHGSLHQVENALSECDVEDRSRLQFQALERLFPLFWRLLLEGRFSHLAGQFQFERGADSNSTSVQT